MALSPAFSGTLSPSVEVNGQTVLAMSKGFGVFQSMAEQIMATEGLVNINPAGWYSAQKWLSAFSKIKAKVGLKTLQQIGAKIPENAAFPPQVNSAHTALGSIDVAYHMNHRNGDIGTYDYVHTGEKSADVVGNNPYPCAFDEGIILAMARRFEPQARLEHDPAECREKGGKRCTYHVTW